MSVFRLSNLVRAPLLDAAEKWIFAAVFAFFASRMMQAYLLTGSLASILYTLDQLVVLVFILIRRSPKELSLRLDDWAVGFLGTLLAVLIGPPGDNPLVPEVIVFVFLSAGFAIHVSAKLTLRRSFGVVAANRGIQASGPYRLVRHPMYLGYVVSQMGMLLAGPTPLNTVVILGCWMIFLGRIVAEERLLSRDPDYLALCAVTRWRLIPGIY